MSGNIDGYPDKDNTRLTKYSFTKQIVYTDIRTADDSVYRLSKLQEATFKYIHIPMFYYEQIGHRVTIESEFIKGYHSFEVEKIYEDCINSAWTFTDPHPSNFITCKQTNKIYMIDLECYRYVPDIEDRKKIWIKYSNKWPIWPWPTYQFDMEGIIFEDSSV